MGRRSKGPGIRIALPLGDMAESALSSVGITKERVTNWLGAPCGCPERKAKLNQFGSWVAGVVNGTIENAGKWLGQMIEDDEKRQQEKQKEDTTSPTNSNGPSIPLK